MKTADELAAELEDLKTQLEKVRGEMLQPGATFVITGLSGIFADDQGIQVGDLAHLQVLVGRVGQINTDGMLNDIAPGTRVAYYVLHNGVGTNVVVEEFN